MLALSYSSHFSELSFNLFPLYLFSDNFIHTQCNLTYPQSPTPTPTHSPWAHASMPPSRTGTNGIGVFFVKVLFGQPSLERDREYHF